MKCRNKKLIVHPCATTATATDRTEGHVGYKDLSMKSEKLFLYLHMETCCNDDVLRLLSYDMSSGLLPANKPYQKAKLERPSITLREAQDRLTNQGSKQKKGYKSYNSLVNSAPLEECQLEIADMQVLKKGQRNNCLSA